MISNLVEALEAFREQGLVGNIQAGWLMVGRRMTERDGIRRFENAFTIHGVEGGWVLGPPPPGPNPTDMHFERLDDAVAEALGWVRALRDELVGD